MAGGFFGCVQQHPAGPHTALLTNWDVRVTKLVVSQQGGSPVAPSPNFSDVLTQCPRG
jgi:hypothetical protein